MEQRERNIRAAIAWKIFEVGDAVTRLAHKVCDDIPTVSTASSEWFAEGQRMGHRIGQKAQLVLVGAHPLTDEDVSEIHAAAAELGIDLKAVKR